MKTLAKIKAGELALALSWGYEELSDAVQWADEQISIEENPNDKLFDLSLSKGSGEAAGVLRSLASDTDKWLVLSHFLSRFYALESMKPEDASKLAKHLYQFISEEDPPKPFRTLANHWDDIDLAIGGSLGEPKDCVQLFLNDIRDVVTSNGGPDFNS